MLLKCCQIMVVNLPTEMCQLEEAFNIKVMTMAAESLWNNGVCEQLNVVIGDKSLLILFWYRHGILLHSICSWGSVNFFSRLLHHQLVLGFTPPVSDVFQSHLPCTGVGFFSQGIYKIVIFFFSLNKGIIREFWFHASEIRQFSNLQLDIHQCFWDWKLFEIIANCYRCDRYFIF